MENVVWINGNYGEDNRIFNSKRQAVEWTDALLPDFGPYFISKINVGYATPDEKVIKYLEYLVETIEVIDEKTGKDVPPEKMKKIQKEKGLR